MIVCDESHRALAPSWVEVIEHFHDERDGDALLLGMTATPRRTDGRSALDVFDQVAYEIAKPELQDLGYLVPIQYWGVKAALSLDRVKRSGGDFQVGALSAVMDTPHRCGRLPCERGKARQTAARRWSSARVSDMRTGSPRISRRGVIAPR